MSTIGSPRGAAMEAAPLFEDVLSLEDDLLSSFPVAALPPLPKPQHAILRVQVLRGVATVLCSIVTGIGAVHALAWYVHYEPAHLWSPLTFAIHTQAVIAIVAHVNLLVCDPGVLPRDRWTSLPVPSVVAERLRAGDSLEGLTNVFDETDVSSYCVRCCVWRRAPPPPAERAPSDWAEWLWRKHPHVARQCPCAGGRKAHHCSTCSRCVVDFDHHCGVLGRCIAGHNMPWFIALLTMAQTAMLTGLLAAFLATYQHFGPQVARYAVYAFLAWIAVGLACSPPVLWRMGKTCESIEGLLSRWGLPTSAGRPMRAVAGPVVPALSLDEEDAKKLPHAAAVVLMHKPANV